MNAKIYYFDTTTLKPAEWNAESRTSEKGLAELIESMRAEGFWPYVPIIITKDKAVADGNRRLAAAKFLGITKVPCMFTDKELGQAWVDSQVGKRTAGNREFIESRAKGLLALPKNKTGARVRTIINKYGEDMIAYMAKHGVSTTMIANAESAARYVGMADDLEYITKFIIPWVTELGQQRDVHFWIVKGFSRTAFKRAIDKNEKLDFFAR